MNENEPKKKKKLIYVLFPIFVIASIVELVILLNLNNKELQSIPKENKKEEKIEKNGEKELIFGDTSILFDSSNVSYDNSTSGLSSTTVKTAIDELYGAANSCVTSLGTCNSDKSSCQSSLSTAQSNYSTCSSSLSTCNSNLTIAQNNMLTYRDEICPGCVYRYSGTQKYNSNSSDADGTNNVLLSSEYTTDYTTLNSNSFLGHVIDSNGYILSSYACGINNGTFFCLRGVDSDQTSLTYKPFYQEWVNVLNKAFPGCNATTSYSSALCDGVVSAFVYSSGSVNVKAKGGGGRCYVIYDGGSRCT